MGIVLGLLLVVLALFPEWFTDTSPYRIQQIRFLKTATSFDVEKAPFKPSPEHLMGTDDLGRDIWSYIAFGTRTTLSLALAAALLQFALALPAALVASRALKGLIRSFATFFAAFPGLLFAILILQIQFFSGLNRLYSTLVFVGMMVFVGWPKLAVLLGSRVETIMDQPFILGAKALGKSKGQIVGEHLVPHLLPEVAVLFFMEVARNLAFMMQLGLFGVFIGNLRLVLETNNGRTTFYNISYEPEWSSMLSTSRTFLTVAPWTVLFPALAFFISVLTFNLFAEGLRQMMQRHNASYGTQMRWLMAKVASRQGLALGLGLLLLAIGTSAYKHWQWDGQFKYLSLNKTPVETTLSTRSSRLMDLEARMQALGMTPQSFHYTLTSLKSRSKTLVDLPPYAEAMASRVDVPGLGHFPLLNKGELDLYRLADQGPDPLRAMAARESWAGKALLLKNHHYSEAYLSYWATWASEVLGASGPSAYLVPSTDQQAQVLAVNALMAGGLEDEVESEPGTTTLGIFQPGSKGNPYEEYIAIGLPQYQAVLNNEVAYHFALQLMQALCKIDHQRRSLIFVFADATWSEEDHGIRAFANQLPPGIDAQDIKVFLDLTHLGEDLDQGGGPKLFFSAAQAPITRQFAWHMGQMLEGDLDYQALKTQRQGAEYRFVDRPSMDAMFWDAGVASIVLGGVPKDWDGLGDLLVDTIRMNNY